MSNDDSEPEERRRGNNRIVTIVFAFCGIFASLEFKLFSLVGLHRAARVPPETETVILFALIFILPLIAIAISRVLEMIANHAAVAAMRHDHGNEVAVAVMMLRNEVKRSLVGKSALLTVSFLAVMLWLTGAANQIALLVGLFSALCLAASVADNLLLAARLKTGRFPENESDARDLLSYICRSKSFEPDRFQGRPILPNDGLSDDGRRIEGAPELFR